MTIQNPTEDFVEEMVTKAVIALACTETVTG